MLCSAPNRPTVLPASPQKRQPACLTLNPKPETLNLETKKSSFPVHPVLALRISSPCTHSLPQQLVTCPAKIPAPAVSMPILLPKEMSSACTSALSRIAM